MAKKPKHDDTAEDEKMLKAKVKPEALKGGKSASEKAPPFPPKKAAPKGK